MTRYERHQLMGRMLLEKFPDLDAALGWRIVDWITLEVLDFPERWKEERS